MALMLPDLTSDGTRRIVACGSIVSENPAISEWFKQQRFLIASYTKGKAKHFVRLISGGGRRATHFHLEVALHSWFRSGLPKAKSRISEVNEIVEKLEGQKTELELSCDFSLPFARLPEGGPIRLLSSETRMAGTSVRLTAGVLSVSGSRISEIAWSRYGEDEVMVTLETHLDTTISPRYLVEGRALIFEYYRVLVLGHPKADENNENQHVS